MKAFPRLATLGLALGLAACNAESTTTPDTPLVSAAIDRDVALSSGDGAAQDVELMGAPGGPLGIGLAPSAAAADDVPFRCGTHTRDGLTIVRTCTFKDAAGATQAGYDPQLTASAAIHVVITGGVTRDNWTATDVSRTRDLVVTGLAGTETQRTWNGTGTGSSRRERHTENGEVRNYTTASTLTVTNVVVPAPRTEDSWPLSGTITRTVTITVVGGSNDGKTRERTCTITFNGTQLVPIQVNDKTFTFDLKTRKIVTGG